MSFSSPGYLYQYHLGIIDELDDSQAVLLNPIEVTVPESNEKGGF